MTHPGRTATVRNLVAPAEVVALDAAAPIRDAAQVMADRQIGSVAVREGGKLVGLVTERDLVATVLARGGDASRPMREAMRPGLPRVKADASETECAALMRDHATRHLLVEDGDEVVGVVSMRDVIQFMLQEKQFLIEQLSSYISGR
ncbi:MAG TPA: CBS domain-containing protein [Anaeromyxobacteraceae bacterium]|nr:CBS domain-containing protein [Anaeromyxobacteraceae bacterium]